MITLPGVLLVLAAGLSVSPGTSYDPAVPTLATVVGHAVGDEISSPAEIHAYLEALAAAAPDRTRLVTYARSEEGRPLQVLVVSGPECMARIEEIQAGLRALADPAKLGPDEAEALVERLPAVVWLLHAVHGDEISSSDAALALAYHILAARDDATVDLIRREAVVLIDPLQNPDGRARFLTYHRLARAASPDAEPAAAEHDEPWPGGRTNHYLFDMNRDWFAQTQPETRGRLKVFLEWFPQVVADLHEMGGDSTYYFAPPAPPLNPRFVESQRGWLDVLGKAIADRFDGMGVPYFVRETFDSFYPGYGETWPMLHGAVGMTFEQASAGGLVWRREDGTKVTYADGVRHHFVAALTTVAEAARGRHDLLRDFLSFRRSAIREGDQGPLRAYVLSPGADPARTRRLATLLVGQGLDVRLASSEVGSGDHRFPAGSIVVPLAQAGGRLVRSLLDPDVPMDASFVREQERRRRKRLPEQFYDVTAWSLPLLFDVPCAGVGASVGDGLSPWSPDTLPEVPAPPAKVAWLLPWGTGTAAAVAEGLQAGLKVRVAEAGFTLQHHDYPPGTAIVRVSENPNDAGTTLARLARAHDAPVFAADSGFVEKGISLGSDQVRALKRPRVLLAWGRPTSSRSAGWARWVFERRYGLPVTAVRVESLPQVELDRFDVLVLPSADYSEAIGQKTTKRLGVWIDQGGTLIAVGEAARWLTYKSVGLLGTKTELRDGRPEPDPTAEGDEKESGGARAAPAKQEGPPPPFDLEKATQPEKERPEPVPGALLRVELDREHWLAAGTDGEVQAVVEGRRVFTPLKLDVGRNVGLYLSKDQIVGGGLVWDDDRALLARKAFLMYQPRGEGHVIAFAEDPNYRGYAEATELLFMNAVLLGPAY
jgi:Zinc carboxypeptidase